MWLPQPFSEAVAEKAAAFWWLMKAITNRRYGQRVIFERGFPVVIMGIDGTWRRACTMLDASETGAKLSLEQGSLNGCEPAAAPRLQAALPRRTRLTRLRGCNGKTSNCAWSATF